MQFGVTFPVTIQHILHSDNSESPRHCRRGDGLVARMRHGCCHLDHAGRNFKAEQLAFPSPWPVLFSYHFKSTITKTLPGKGTPVRSSPLSAFTLCKKSQHFPGIPSPESPSATALSSLFIPKPAGVQYLLFTAGIIIALPTPHILHDVRSVA